MITRNLLERALDLLTIASDDAHRPHLCGVLITCTERIGEATPKVVMVATDGHKLAERTFYVRMPLGKYFLRHDAKAALKLVLKETKSMAEIPADISSDGGLLVGLTTKALIEKNTGDYPDYEYVIPKHTNPVAITLNAEYLLALAKVLQDG